MTEQVFFDTDCLSAFLWVNNQSILAQLYPGKIVVPSQVYSELSYPGTPHLKARIDSMVANNEASIKDFDVGSDMYTLYVKMTSNPDEGHRIIGSGEAAGIAMAKAQNGILASNNLRDIKQYYEDSDDFAGTEANKVVLNGIFYNDTEILAKEYESKVRQGFFCKGTTWKDIIFHEMGHVVCNLYGVNPLEIAKNLLHTNLKAEVAEFVAANLSLYSARSYESIISNQVEFDGSEIIAECFCSYYSGTNNDFAKLFVEACKKITRR